MSDSSEPSKAKAVDGLSRRAFTRVLGSAAVAGSLADTSPGEARGVQPAAAAAALKADEIPFVSAIELAARMRASRSRRARS